MGENMWRKALDGVRFVIACYKLRNVIKLMSRIETLSTSVGKAQATPLDCRRYRCEVHK